MPKPIASPTYLPQPNLSNVMDGGTDHKIAFSYDLDAKTYTTKPQSANAPSNGQGLMHLQTLPRGGMEITLRAGQRGIKIGEDRYDEQGTFRIQLSHSTLSEHAAPVYIGRSKQPDFELKIEGRSVTAISFVALARLAAAKAPSTGRESASSGAAQPAEPKIGAHSAASGRTETRGVTTRRQAREAAANPVTIDLAPELAPAPSAVLGGSRRSETSSPSRQLFREMQDDLARLAVAPSNTTPLKRKILETSIDTASAPEPKRYGLQHATASALSSSRASSPDMPLSDGEDEREAQRAIVKQQAHETPHLSEPVRKAIARAMIYENGNHKNVKRGQIRAKRSFEKLKSDLDKSAFIKESENLSQRVGRGYAYDGAVRKGTSDDRSQDLRKFEQKADIGLFVANRCKRRITNILQTPRSKANRSTDAALPVES